MSASVREPVPLAVALSGEQLVALLASQDLRQALSSAGLAFAVAAYDRIAGDASLGPTLEPSLAVTSLAEQEPATTWLIAASCQIDHPYNLARRVASADHLTGGRIGLLLGSSDRAAPPVRRLPRRTVDTQAASPSPSAADVTLDAARAIRALWRSWPDESIVADRATGIYARAERIHRVAHRGIFDIDGPLTVPTTPQGTPPLGWCPQRADEVDRLAAVAEFIVLPARLLAIWPQGTGLAGAGDSIWVEVSTAEEVEGTVRAALSRALVGGVLLVPAPDASSLVRTLSCVVPGLVSAGLAVPAQGRTLRERLSLPVPGPVPANGPPAFPAPEPLRTA